jgi:hypothetical protein
MRDMYGLGMLDKVVSEDGGSRGAVPYHFLPVPPKVWESCHEAGRTVSPGNPVTNQDVLTC